MLTYCAHFCSYSLGRVKFTTVLGMVRWSTPEMCHLLLCIISFIYVHLHTCRSPLHCLTQKHFTIPLPHIHTYTHRHPTSPFTHLRTTLPYPLPSLPICNIITHLPDVYTWLCVLSSKALSPAWYLQCGMTTVKYICGYWEPKNNVPSII